MISSSSSHKNFYPKRKFRDNFRLNNVEAFHPATIEALQMWVVLGGAQWEVRPQSWVLRLSLAEGLDS